MRLLPRVAPVLLLLALTAPAARADRIIFACGSGYANLCAIASDGSGRTQLTSNASGAGDDRYASPSLSADGSRLAYLYKGQSYVGSADAAPLAGPEGGPGAYLITRMKPDGSALAVGEFSTGGVCVYSSSLTGRDCVGTAGSYGWAPDGNLLAQETRTNQPTAICLLPIVVTPPDLTGCHGDVLTDPALDLSDPTTSPNGQLIAVTRSTPGESYGRIAIYDAASHAFLREVSAGPDAFPAWSPDSAAVAFTRKDGGGLFIASATGTPGAERQLVADGRDATWGGPVGGGGGAGGGGGGAGGGGGGGAGTPPPASTAKPAARTCTVPSLVGLSLARAKLKLKTAHCATPSVAHRRATRRHRGRVVAQSVRAHTKISRSRKVKLTVGR